MNSLLTAAYTWNINEDWLFDALVGNELVENQRKFYESYGANYNFPGWNHIDNATTMVASESLRRKRTVGNFASISLSYANMVYFNATVRNDIVSNMPRNNRSFTYPSVSLGWIFTELEPLKNNVLTYGKLRASYAEVGQAGDYYDSYYTTPVYGGGFYGSTPIQYPMSGITAFTPYARVYDPNLKPQNTKSYELGVDLTFLNGLFSLNYTFSRQNVKDQIFEVPLAGSTGSAELVTNGGAIHTNAHEITLGINPINTKNFKWDMAFNFSKIDNYVDELAPGVESIFLGGFVDPQVRANIGDKFPVIYGTTFLRNDNGDIVVDEDGLPQIGSEGVIGKVSPDFLLGFNTNFEIYKFRTGATFDWKCGGQMYSGTLNTLNYYGTSMESVESRTAETFRFSHPAVKQLEDGSYVANDIDIKGEDALSYYDRMTLISEAGIYDSGFLKLRELSVSYPVWDKNGINVNLNVFARNIILWSELKGLDPEASQGNNNMEVNIKSALASDYWGGFLNVTNEVTPEEAASYFDENVAPLFDANPLKETMIQKYISFWNADGESTECYNDVRRLKSLGEDIYGLQNPGKFPLRCPYGNDDTTTNPNIQAAYGDGQYVFTENVWWAGGTR